MNQGKRYIRNTVIALCGVTVLIVIAERVYASTIGASTPQWLRSVMSLGFAVDDKRPESRAGALQVVDLGQLRDFTRLSVEGDFAVEVVSAPQYKVSLTPASGETWSVGTEWQRDGLLRLKGGAGTTGAVLRVEAPALTSIEAQGLAQLTVRGWTAREMTLRMKDLAGVRLEESAVGHWILHAETPVVMQADKATAAAGLNIQASGQISILGAGGQKILDFRGTGGQVSIRTNK